MKNNAMAMGVKTRIIYGALAIMTIILSMGENTMAQTKSTTVVRNIVLVHGGFVDGSGWEGVYNVLKKDDYTVTVVQNPTISLADDVAAGSFSMKAETATGVSRVRSCPAASRVRSVLMPARPLLLRRQ
jgi:hypothetical protein